MSEHWFKGPGWYTYTNKKMCKITQGLSEIPDSPETCFPFTINEDGEVVRAILWNGEWKPTTSDFY